MAKRSFETDLDLNDAFTTLKRVCADIGKVKEVMADTRSLKMKARYGLNPVTLRASVLSSNQGGSVIELEARGQDVWGVASRTVMDRLAAAFPPPTQSTLPPPPTASSTNQESVLSVELRELKQLFDEGVLTEEEFTEAKKKLF
jgi:hypothetical protein